MTKNKAVKTAAQTAALMMILTLVSKGIGFVREMIMAGFFGTGYIVDAYVMAIAVPGMIFGGLFGAVDTAYIPLFSRKFESAGEREGNRFTSETITLQLAIAIVASVVGIVFSEQLVGIFASQFTGEEARLTGYFLKITFSYTLFTSVSGLLEAFLRYKGVFLAPIVIGYLQNAIVIGVVIGSYYFDHHLLAWSWMIAYIARMLIVWHLSKKNGFKYTFSPKIGTSAKKVLALTLPVFLGSYINQINAFVDKSLASGLQEGSIAALNYGNLLVGIISGLTVSLIMSIIYPKMAQAQALEEYDRFNEIAATGFNLILIITVPFTFGAILYSNEVVQIIYERGAFDTASTALTATAFLFYALGLVFMSLNNLFVQAYYSMHDMKTPVIYGAIGVIINIILNLILVKYMAHGGLALATSIAAAVNAMLLYRGLRKKHNHVNIIESKMKILKIVLVAAVAVGVAYGLSSLIEATIWMPRMILMCIRVGIAGIIYLMGLRVIKVKELRFLKQLVKSNREGASK